MQLKCFLHFETVEIEGGNKRKTLTSGLYLKKTAVKSVSGTRRDD